MSKIRIVHIIPTLDQSGAEKQLALLATHSDKERFDVHVVALTRGGFYEQSLLDAGVPVHRIGKRFKGDPIALLKLTKLLRTLEPAIVQTWMFAGNSYGRAAARWVRAAAVIATERCVDSWKSRAQLTIDRWLSRWTDKFAVNSEAVGLFYVEQGIPAEKIRVIVNAVPAAVVVPTDVVEKLRQQLSIPSGKVIVACIGRLWPQKRVEDLICAADIVRIADLPIHLLVVGDGPRRAMLQQVARRMEFQDHVQFLGHRTDVDQLLELIDVLALSSEFEGMPNVVLEAMRAGKPVIATRIPGMDELVREGETGLLVPPRKPFELARALNKLVVDAELRRRLGEAGRRRAGEQFTIERMVESYAQLYEELAPRGR